MSFAKKHMEKVAKIWHKILETPVTNAHYVDKDTLVKTHCQGNIETNRKESFLQYYKRCYRTKEFLRVGLPIPLNYGASHFYSPSGSKLCVISPKIDSKQDGNILEVYQSGRKLFALSPPKTIHGNIYTSPPLGGLSWSKNEQKIVYVAESYPGDNKSFYEFLKKESESKSQDLGNETKENKKVHYGLKNTDFEDWGENLVGVKNPSLFVLDLKSKTSTEVASLPEDFSFGSPSFADNDNALVFAGFKSSPNRRGLYAYNTRPSKIFLLNGVSNGAKETKDLRVLSSSDEHSCFEPRVSPDGKTVMYLSTPHNAKTHLACCEARVVDLVTMENRILVPLTTAETSNEFPGIFCFYQPEKIWLENGKFVVLNSFIGSNNELLKIDVNTGEVTPIGKGNESKSCRMVDIKQNCLLVAVSSPSQPEIFCEIDLETKALGHWSNIENEKSQICENIKSFEILKIEAKHGIFKSILVKPENDGNKCPVIILLHGGPHSVFPSNFSRTTWFLCSLGFAVCGVNFTGSIGYGQKFLEGNIGTTNDLDDIVRVLEKLKKDDSLDVENVGLCGGSYGGYLTCMLSGKYPGRFKAAIALNPVTCVGTLATTSDIPDWGFVETGQKWEETQLIKPENYEKMFKWSPIFNIDKITTPMMLLLGKEDRRVPYLQNKTFWEGLKARGISNRTVVYEKGSHSLNNDLEMECDVAINMGLWMLKHLT